MQPVEGGGLHESWNHGAGQKAEQESYQRGIGDGPGEHSFFKPAVAPVRGKEDPHRVVEDHRGQGEEQGCGEISVEGVDQGKGKEDVVEEGGVDHHGSQLLLVELSRGEVAHAEAEPHVGDGEKHDVPQREPRQIGLEDLGEHQNWGHDVDEEELEVPWLQARPELPEQDAKQHQRWHHHEVG